MTACKHHLPTYPLPPGSNRASPIAFMRKEEYGEEEVDGGGGGDAPKFVVVCKGCRKPMFEYTGVTSQKHYYCSTRAAEVKDYPATCVGMLNGDLHNFLISRVPAAISEFAKKGAVSISTPATKGPPAFNMALDGGGF